MGSMTAVKNMPSGMNQLFFVTAAWRSSCFPLALPSVATQSRRTPTHHKSFERGSDGAAAAVVALSSNMLLSASRRLASPCLPANVATEDERAVTPPPLKKHGPRTHASCWQWHRAPPPGE